jgi:hypothetical protein
MLKFWVGCVCVLFSLTTLACENVDRRTCKKQLGALVSYRAEAIENAFGDLSDAFPIGLKVKFVQTSDPEYAMFSGRVAYDQAHRALSFRIVSSAQRCRIRCAPRPTTGRSIKVVSTAKNFR